MECWSDQHATKIKQRQALLKELGELTGKDYWLMLHHEIKRETQLFLHTLSWQLGCLSICFRVFPMSKTDIGDAAEGDDVEQRVIDAFHRFDIDNSG